MSRRWQDVQVAQTRTRYVGKGPSLKATRFMFFFKGKTWLGRTLTGLIALGR